MRKTGKRVSHIQFEFSIKEIAAEKKSLTIDEFVRLNPATTKGKTELEVRKLMKQQPLV